MPTHTMPSPLPGTFYRRPSPGDTIGLVEVMKTFSPVTAEMAGTIAAFHVEDQDAVMAGQPLADIET